MRFGLETAYPNEHSERHKNVAISVRIHALPLSNYLVDMCTGGKPPRWMMSATLLRK